MKKISLLLIGLILSTVPAHAEKWIQLEAGYFVDASSLTKYYLPNLDNVYSIWTKSYNDGSDLFQKNDDYFNVQVLIDCDNAKSTVKSGKIYLKNGNIKPGSLSSIRNDNLEWINVTPNSKSEVDYNYVCQPGIKNAKIETNKNNSDAPLASEIYKQNLNSMLFVQTQTGTGSGVIVKDDGTFVTCFHVIADADYIKVKTADGKEYFVDGFKYINPLADVAILTLNTSDNFKPINLLNTKSEIGETIYTISNPKGIEFSFSNGLISQYSSENIQFTAPISPGSSGGALLNKNGELLGIITSYRTDAQNINFALPNSYYISKINDSTIKNSKNEKWTDFVLHNASEEQYKLTIGYAMTWENFKLLYKYIKPYAELKDYPKDMYAYIGYIAFYIYLFEGGSDETLQDAISWYKISLDNNLYEELSSLALFSLYCIKDVEGNIDKLDKLIPIISKYPNSVAILTEASKCSEGDSKCYENFATKLILYIHNLTGEIYWNNNTGTRAIK